MVTRYEEIEAEGETLREPGPSVSTGSKGGDDGNHAAHRGIAS